MDTSWTVDTAAVAGTTVEGGGDVAGGARGGGKKRFRGHSTPTLLPLTTTTRYSVVRRFNTSRVNITTYWCVTSKILEFFFPIVVVREAFVMSGKQIHQTHKNQLYRFLQTTCRKNRKPMIRFFLVTRGTLRNQHNINTTRVLRIFKWYGLNYIVQHTIHVRVKILMCCGASGLLSWSSREPRFKNCCTTRIFIALCFSMYCIHTLAQTTFFSQTGKRTNAKSSYKNKMNNTRTRQV